jgi:hypothetical protein
MSTYIITALSNASIKRFLFLIMPRRRDRAKSERKSNNDQKRMVSWVLALLFVVGTAMALRALDIVSREGRTAERAEVRLLGVL